MFISESLKKESIQNLGSYRFLKLQSTRYTNWHQCDISFEIPSRLLCTKNIVNVEFLSLKNVFDHQYMRLR